VVFLHTTGDVLDEAGQAALERYVAGGGGFAGVHSAADTEYDWAWYGELVGAYFASHPPVTPAVVRVEDPNHPSTAHLPAEWARADEWYAFRSNPRGRVHVLATVDESSYEPGAAAMGADHPIVCCHEIGAGRAWYTALGHTPESYADPVFREHLWNGIKSAAGAVAADC
jgi:cytochrome c